MSKAYDRVEWGFLDSIMERLEPCAKWRGWINECINSVSYQILINGKASNWFQASKGIRQGDPLSRYLFLLCTGGFNAFLRKAVSDGYINGIRVYRCSPPVSHLFFADDYLLFIKRGLTAINNLQAILASFEKVSGQKINFDKSTLCCNPAIGSILRESISNSLQVRVVENLDKYLRLPTFVGQNKRLVFGSIRDKDWKKIKSQKGFQFSKAGKKVLIKAILQALPTFFGRF